jgi:plasmid stabilization system protein ParE
MRVVLHGAYERSVDKAQDYLVLHYADAAARHLLNRAYDFLPDLLSRFPHIGRDFLARNPKIPETFAAWQKARELVGDDILLREHVLDEYLVLYATQRDTIHLLTLRHHSRSGFHFSEE